jgi:tetratricopeptide (TPR) repeat protein
LTIKPGNAEALFYLGTALTLNVKKDSAEGIECYYKVLEKIPDHTRTHILLVKTYEVENKLEQAEKHMEKLRSLAPDDLLVRIYEAKLLERRKEYKNALDILQTIEIKTENMDDDTKLLYYQTLATIYDHLGDPDNAYINFEKNSKIAQKKISGMFYPPELSDALIKAYRFNFTEETISSWLEYKNHDGYNDPVFFVGFPRSGTTLLENVLDSHREVSSLSERQVLAKLRHNLIKTNSSNFPGVINSLNEDKIKELRDLYFSRAKQYTNINTPLLLDKFPLQIMDLALICKVFPNTKIIYAMRHPCDSVLSCFMQSFSLNHAMAHFTSLEESAQFYAEVMNLFLHYKKVLPLPMHEYRYERMVEDFEGETRAVLDFLGLEWSGDINRYAEKAREKGRISTPSYSQVVQPIYKTSRGRWQKYRKYMEPVLPILEPYVKEFGYSLD